MTGDTFKEQIVKKKPTPMDAVKRVGLVLGVIIVFFASFTFIPTAGAPIAMLLTFGAGFGAWYLMSFLYVEYEYTFVGGDLDIDVIYNRSRRKPMFSVRASDIEIMAHIDDNLRAAEFEHTHMLLDFSSGTVTPNTYLFRINYLGKMTKVVIEPNEKMLKALSTSLSPRKLFIKK